MLPTYYKVLWTISHYHTIKLIWIGPRCFFFVSAFQFTFHYISFYFSLGWLQSINSWISWVNFSGFFFLNCSSPHGQVVIAKANDFLHLWKKSTSHSFTKMLDIFLATLNSSLLRLKWSLLLLSLQIFFPPMWLLIITTWDLIRREAHEEWMSLSVFLPCDRMAASIHAFCLQCVVHVRLQSPENTEQD